MPVGELLMSLASVHTVIGKFLSESTGLANTPNPNKSCDYKSVNLSINSSANTDNQTVFHIQQNEKFHIVSTEVTTKYYNGTVPNYLETHNADSLSIMWYLASFGALIMFFLLISLSEVCCKKSFSEPPDDKMEVSPPPYDLFAPPTYDSLYETKIVKNHKKKRKIRKYEVFVIPVFGDKSASRTTDPESNNSAVVPV